MDPNGVANMFIFHHHMSFIIIISNGYTKYYQVCDWRLNERHDGALTGLNKKMAVLMYGERNVSVWRRSYAVAPPPLELQHPCEPPAPSPL